MHSLHRNMCQSNVRCNTRTIRLGGNNCADVLAPFLNHIKTLSRLSCRGAGRCAGRWADWPHSADLLSQPGRAGNQRPGGKANHRVAPGWGDGSQWPQHEGPPVAFRMRQDQRAHARCLRRMANDVAARIDDIDIEHTCGPTSHAHPPPGGALDPLCQLQQREGARVAVPDYHRVQVWRLSSTARKWLVAPDQRFAYCPETLLAQSLARLVERGERRSPETRKVGPEGNDHQFRHFAETELLNRVKTELMCRANCLRP